MARVWLTLPTFNEVGNVDRIVRAALEALERAVPGDHRVLIVDDASPDGTGEVADLLAAELPAVEVLHRSGKEGLGRAYRLRAGARRRRGAGDRHGRRLLA
jgi:dolichol-phosphate mannosyltransferase